MAAKNRGTMIADKALQTMRQASSTQTSNEVDVPQKCLAPVKEQRAPKLTLIQPKTAEEQISEIANKLTPFLPRGVEGVL